MNCPSKVRLYKYIVIARNGETYIAWCKNVKQAIEEAKPHLSCYGIYKIVRLPGRIEVPSQ